MAVTLAEVAPDFARILEKSVVVTPPRFGVSEIHFETVMVQMRDGVRLATTLYIPPQTPAPVIALRTPYGRNRDGYAGAFLSFARRGYAIATQDCRATGQSEPESWDYYMFEQQDGYDFVEWISTQEWSDGFIGALGGSYDGQTQWPMALHPAMSTIVPEVSGLGVAINTVRHHGTESYALTIGKGPGKISNPDEAFHKRMHEEKMATGFFNEPLYRPIPGALLERFPAVRTLPPREAQRWLWEQYASSSCADRASIVKEATGTSSVTTVQVESLSAVFGQEISHDAHTVPHAHPEELCASFHTPILLRTGWYDHGLNDALETWEMLGHHAPEKVRKHSRLFIGPNAHNIPGYREGMGERPELRHAFGVTTNFEMFLRWYETVRNDAFDAWPPVVYYLMGANEWRCANAWPVAGAGILKFRLGAQGTLHENQSSTSEPDRYTYDPLDPTPSMPEMGSLDVSAVQQRTDVLTYTSAPLPADLDVVGPLRLVLYASSSAVDTDFFVRLSDVFPDGRALWIQSGALRMRYRNVPGEVELLEPGRVYRLEIDMWATANRFKAGHSIRLDICSADFPSFTRNANRGGEPGSPISATQAIYHDPEHPSHLLLPTLH